MDKGGFGGFGGFGGAGGFEDIGDILKVCSAEFWLWRGASRRNPNAPQRGNDLQQAITISFEEANFGITKEISVNREEEARKCGGSGARSRKMMWKHVTL